MKPFLALAALALCAIPAHADATYTYQGNPLDDPGSYPNQPSCTCSISGQMTFAQPLALPTDIETVSGTPESYWFSVDGYTLDQSNSAIQDFGLGDLNWLLQILGNNGLTIYIGCVDGCGNGGGATDFAGFGGIDTIGLTIGHPGTWTAPEPSSLYLLAFGFAGLALKRKVA